MQCLPVIDHNINAKFCYGNFGPKKEKNMEISRKWILLANTPARTAFTWKLLVMEIKFKIFGNLKCFFCSIFVYARKLSWNFQNTGNIYKIWLSPLRHSFVPYEIVVMIVQHKLNYLYIFVPKIFENEKLWKIEIFIFLLKTTKPQFWLWKF